MTVDLGRSLVVLIKTIKFSTKSLLEGTRFFLVLACVRMMRVKTQKYCGRIIIDDSRKNNERF